MRWLPMKPAHPVTTALANVDLRLDDPSVIEFDDPVRGPGEPRRVRDEQARAAAHQAVEAFEHLVLAVLVQRGGGLVEDDHRRVAQQRAGDPDALPLAAGEAHALGAEFGVVALGEGLDELVRRGRLGGLDDVVWGGVRAVGDVLADRAGEEDRVLQDDRDLVAQPGCRAVAEVAAIECDRPLGGVIEAGDEGRQGRLPGTGWAGQREPLAGGKGEADVAQRAALVVVFEGDAGEFDRAFGSGAPSAARISISVVLTSWL